MTIPKPRLVMKPASSFKTRTTRWLWEGRMPLGEITLVAGREGAGKGMLMSHIVARITRGKLEGEYYGTPQSVAVAAHEDSWEKTIVPRLRVAGADLSKVFHPIMQDWNEDKGKWITRKLVFPDDLPRIGQMAIKSGVVMLALDPMMSALSSDIDLYKSPKVRPVLEAFRASLDKADVSCFGIVHFNKTAEGDSLTKIANSRAIVEVARAAIVLGEDKDPEGEDKGVIIVSQPRNNLGRTDLPNLAFVKEGRDFTADDGRVTNVGKLRWVSKDYGKTADEALNAKTASGPKPPTKWDQLKEQIADLEGRDFTAAELAEATGIAVATVRVELSRAVQRKTLVSRSRGVYRQNRTM